MVNEETGWALSTGGRMLRTGDGGRTWSDVTPSEVVRAAPSAGICLGTFAGKSEAWCLDPDTSVIYHSPDAGASWDRLATITPGISNDGGELLTFADSRHGWLEVMSGSHHDRGEIFSTPDGGATWKRVYRGPLAGDLMFADANHGWLGTGSILYRTDDGGKTWQTVDLPAGPLTWVGLPTRFGPTFVLAGTEQGSEGPNLAVLASRSGGTSWTVLFTHSEPSPSTAAVAAADRNDAWVATAIGGVAYRTRDAGLHWDSFAIPDGYDAEVLDFVSPNAGWMVAGDDRTFEATLFKTGDGGKTWLKVSPVLVAAH